MKLEALFTEYDELITGGINLDPLGMLVIWSAYGQKVFNNRVNSISNDVRNYTLNLFHHYVIRELINDNRYELSNKLKSEYGEKDSLRIKNACIVYLENIFVYSVLWAEGKNMEVDSSGVLGSSKGRKKWEDSDKDPELKLSDHALAHILVRQLGLGVSGRYKTPLIEIGLFDKSYDYGLPSAEELWKTTKTFIHSTSQLKSLSKLLVEHLGVLISSEEKIPTTLFSDIRPKIKKEYINAFKESKSVGEYSRKYWLSVTDLDKGAAGALLGVIDANEHGKMIADKDIFVLAKQKMSDVEEGYWAIDAIEQIEPFLAEVTLLFNLLRSKAAIDLGEVERDWKDFGRNKDTLPMLAAAISGNERLMSVLMSTGRERLRKLLRLREATTLDTQVDIILAYHKEVMRIRGQSEWVIAKGSEYKAYIRLKNKPTKQESPPGYWFNRYYLPQFTNLAKGLQGLSS